MKYVPQNRTLQLNIVNVHAENNALYFNNDVLQVFGQNRIFYLKKPFEKNSM